MRKYIAMLFAIICLSFAGCGDDPVEPAVEGSSESAKAEISGETVGSDNSNHIFVPDITEEIETEVTDAVTVGNHGNFVPEESPAAETSKKPGKEDVGDVTPDTEGEKEDPEKGENTTAVTLPPVLQTLPEDGVELPDDKWE